MTGRASCSASRTRSSARSSTSSSRLARTYAVGTAFLPGDDDQVAKTRRRIEEIAAEEGLSVLGWRDVPTDPSMLGATAPSA